MKKCKERVLRLIAKAGMKSAIKAAGAASCFGYHQAKEPQKLYLQKIKDIDGKELLL